MAYTRKTVDTWQMWVNYGSGWEHETTEDSRAEAKAQQKCYRENCPEYPTRIKKVREPKEINAGPPTREDMDGVAVGIAEMNAGNTRSIVEIRSALKIKACTCVKGIHGTITPTTKETACPCHGYLSVMGRRIHP